MADNGIPNVQFIRPEVEAMQPRWDLIRDCLGGQDSIKEAGDTYLPRPNPSDTSEENVERYAQYLERAVFYNVAQRTHAGLVGQVFQKPPVLETPAQLEPVVEDADGSGVGLISQAKKALGLVVGHGRCGLLVDHPETQEATTREAVLDGVVRPTISLYEPDAIINWRTRVVGTRKKLSLVVLVEPIMEYVDEFESEQLTQYRVLRLNENGVYTVQLYRTSGEDEGTAEPSSDVIVPTDVKGVTFNEIPFTFIGSVNNDDEIDLPPLYDLCVLNISHYRNSADWEESCYIVGQPTPVITGLTEEWVKDVLHGSVRLGSRSAIPLPQGGTAIMLQAAPNTMPAEGMKRKEAQMVALGAKLIEEKQIQRTATDARMEYATEISVLGTAAANTAEAYRRALGWCGLFSGADGPSKFEIAVEFELGKLTAQEIQAVMTTWQGNGISTTEMRDKLKKAGLAFQDDEEYQAEVDSKPPSYGIRMPAGMENAQQGKQQTQQQQSEGLAQP